MTRKCEHPKDKQYIAGFTMWCLSCKGSVRPLTLDEVREREQVAREKAAKRGIRV